MSNLNLTAQEIDYILSPHAIRDQAKRIFRMTQENQTAFVYNSDKFDSTVDYVLKTINKNYPDLNIPFHSRWGHFRAGKIDRTQKLNTILSSDPMERARSKLDLVITSVLLDAGAGSSWKFTEENTAYSRSEGLGLASFYMFLDGAMSSDKNKIRADLEGLKKINSNDLKKYFQVTESNPLIGVEGRVQLLNNLSKALENKKIFSENRPGNILDYLVEKHGKTIPAESLLRAVLDGLGPIWPGRLMSNGTNLGDVWKHSKISGNKKTDSLIPFHKLSQWMTYSLIEPILEAGIEVNGVENLTGLAEYRNGGLLIDSGLISFKKSLDQNKSWSPDTDLIIEWRALTVYLLDQIGDAVQKKLNKSPQDFPLAKVLEGGTWWAGRFLALEKRENGNPPIQIISDGTVF